MMLEDRIRAALAGYRDVTIAEMFGGLVLWDGDPLLGVMDGDLIARADPHAVDCFAPGWTSVPVADVASDVALDLWISRARERVKP